MDNRENQITSSQLMTFIISIQVGIGVLRLPAYLSITSGHDGWISILVVGIVIAIVILIITKLMNRYTNQSIYEINKFLYGKYLGNLLNLLIVLYLWYSACLYLKIYINLIHVYLLRSTPTLVLDVFVLIPTYYLTWYGLKYVARFSITVYVALFLCCVFFLLVFKDLRLNFLLPVGESGIEGIKLGFAPCIAAFFGYEIISIIYPEITNKQKVIKYSLIGNTTMTIFYMIVLLVTASFLGEEMLKKSVYPIIQLSRSYRAPILERVDLLFIAVWLPTIAMAVRGYFSVSYYSIHKLLKLKKKGIHLVAFTLITILLSNVPKSYSSIDIYSKGMLIPGVFFTLLLVISYLFSFIRKKGVKPRA